MRIKYLKRMKNFLISTLLLVTFSASAQKNVAPPVPVLPVPTEAQLPWDRNRADYGKPSYKLRINIVSSRACPVISSVEIY